MAVRPKNLHLRIANGCNVIDCLLPKHDGLNASFSGNGLIDSLVLSFCLLFISMHFGSPLEVIRRDRLVYESKASEWAEVLILLVF